MHINVSALVIWRVKSSDDLAAWAEKAAAIEVIPLEAFKSFWWVAELMCFLQPFRSPWAHKKNVLHTVQSMHSLPFPLLVRRKKEIEKENGDKKNQYKPLYSYPY